MLVKCGQCEKGFNKPLSHIKRAKEIFCSNKCRGIAQHLTAKVLKKCKICENEFSARLSEASRFSTCDNEMCRFLAKAKEHNPNWKGGRPKRRPTSSKEYKAWRKSILLRDNYSCQFCKTSGVTMHVDHIKPWAYFPELRYSTDNGRALCAPCHFSIMKEVFKCRG